MKGVEKQGIPGVSFAMEICERSTPWLVFKTEGRNEIKHASLLNEKDVW